MRDILVALILVGLMPTCFRRPFIGLVVFSWLAYMRVQDLTWGFARGIRWSYYIAMLMFFGFFAGPKKRLFIPDVRAYMMMALVVLFGIGLTLSNPDEFTVQRYLEYIKIVVIALFTTAVVQTREHLRVLVWVIALSLGFYGVKIGLWVILTGGGKVLQGPGGMLADNNDLSMALAMAVPMLFHIGMSEKREILRRAFFLTVPLTVLTIGATYSRGGFLAVGTAIGILVWRSRNRVAGVLIGILVVIIAVIAMPEDYKKRLATLKNPQAEGSAAGRLRAWGVATDMAKANPFFGVGFGQFRANWLNYCKNPTPQELRGKAVIVAHSSYFQIWAECGTPALVLYLLLIAFSFFTCWRIRRLAVRRYFSSWIINYATMFEASLAAFAVGSAFLNRAHFDLFYHWVAIIIVFSVIAQREMQDMTAYPERPTGSRGALAAVKPRGFGVGTRADRPRGFRNAPLLPERA